MVRVTITGLFLGVLAIASAGCQSKSKLSFASVEGTVTKGGRPLAGVIVDFYPEPGDRGPRSTSAPTDEAGHYQLHSSWGGDDGAVVGLHRVCIADAPKDGDKILGRLTKKAMSAQEIQREVRRFEEATPVFRRVPPRYSQPNETPLRVEVHPGSQVIDLEVK